MALSAEQTTILGKIADAKKKEDAIAAINTQANADIQVKHEEVNVIITLFERYPSANPSYLISSPKE